MDNNSDVTGLLQHLDDNYAVDNIPTMIFLALLMIVGCVGNILVFFVYLTKMKPSTTRCFILALSFLDLITCSICIPIDIADFRYNFTFGQFGMFVCQLSVVVAFTSFASGNILIAVAVERYRKICNPTGQQITIKSAKVAILLSSVVAIFESGPSFVVYGKHTKQMLSQNFSVNATLCTTADEYIDTLFPLVNNGLQFAFFLAATITLATLYSIIWKKVSQFAERKKWSWKFKTSLDDSSCVSIHDRKVPADVDSSPKNSTNTNSVSTAMIDKQGLDKSHVFKLPSQRQMSARRTTIMLFIITFTFIVSYLPHLSLMAAREVHWEKIENLSGPALAVYNVFLRSYFINSAINPIIYSYCNVRAGNEIKAFVSFKRCRN